MHLLRAARAMGDVLLLGVNTDASVRRLKGPERPVLPLEARVLMLTELRSVDLVIPFDEDTPLALIREITPDVLVKGGDYTVDTVVGAETVISSGGSVRIVPLVAGYSTTSIIGGTGGHMQDGPRTD